MELSRDVPCEDSVHEVSESRGCSHFNSYLNRRDSENPEKHRVGMSYRVCRDVEKTNRHILAGNYMDYSEDERRIGWNLLGSKSHRHDRRSEYHKASKTDSHPRGRSRYRAETSDPFSFRRRRSTKSRRSRRSRIRRRRSRSRTTSRSSSGKSRSRSLERCCMKCNSTLKYNRAIKQIENQEKKLNLACRSHACLERRSTYVTEHSYSQCCPQNLTCCCSIHSCHSRKRKCRHYSSESDECPSFRRRNYYSQPEHAHGCHTRVSACSCYVCKGMPCNDSQFGLYSTVSTKCKTVAPIGGCMKSALSSPYAGHCVQNPEVCDRSAKAPYEHREGSLNISNEKNELWSSCAGEKVKFVSGQAKTEEYQDQWLKLSLKTPQSSGIKVEGIFKNDLKLSLPDFKGDISREVSAPTLLNVTGFHSSGKTIMQAETDGFSADSSRIHFSIWNPNVDTSSCSQPEGNIHFSNVVYASTMLPNLNLPENNINMDSGATTSIFQGKLASGFDQNCHYSPTTELQCTILHTSNLAISGISDNTLVSGHAVPPNQGDKKTSDLTNFPYNEKDSQLQAISASGPADCGICTNCDATQVLQFESTKELTGSVIIIADSEDDCFEESSLHGLHGKNNLFGSTGNITMQEGISHDNVRNDPIHETEGDCVQNTLFAGNILCSDKPEFGLANTGEKDEVAKNVNLGGPSCSQSSENIEKCAVQLAEDKCKIVEVISSEDESTDNGVCNVALPLKNGTLHESGGTKLQDCVASRGPHYITLSEDESFSHEDNETSQVVDNAGRGSPRDGRVHKKIDSCPVNESGNIETACSSEGISSTLDCKHFYRSRVEALFQLANSKPRLWDSGILCDLCGRGPSLTYGEWYSWCCGYRLFYCKCTEDHKRKLKLSMNQKNKKISKRWDGHQWSGKVHRMCGLWSSEVFEKDDGRDQLEGLVNAVRRGRNLSCKDPDCRRFGATLGCRVKKCQRSFHYPCAVKLASQLNCRMWEGCRRPIACGKHRHVDRDCISAKDRQSFIKGNHGNKVASPTKGSMNIAIDLERHSYENMASPNNAPPRADINLSIDEQETTEVTAVNMDNVTIPRGLSVGPNDKAGSSALLRKGKTIDQINAVKTPENDGMVVGRRVQYMDNVKYLGKNLICVDISDGMETVSIPCTNDIDGAPAPSFDYITYNRFSEHADVILKSVLADMEKQAKPCNGCSKIDMDDPEACISVHVDASEGRRDQDRRIDWQGEPMFGRLPYDHYGLLQLGWLTIDVVECNSRCQCGPDCVNRELQKGLCVALEVFKTEERGWGVRTLESIPRGKFVLEYVGEMLTEGEVSKRGLVYPAYTSSYLFNVDHPAVPQEDHLVLDGFKKSNVGRFINHSCEGNLSIYRVYTETLDNRIYRIGLYAGRDIESGEELTYDYKYIQEPGVPADDPAAFKCFCRTKSCRQVSLSSEG